MLDTGLKRACKQKCVSPKCLEEDRVVFLNRKSELEY